VQNGEARRQFASDSGQNGTLKTASGKAVWSFPQANGGV